MDVACGIKAEGNEETPAVPRKLVEDVMLVYDFESPRTVLTNKLSDV